MNTPENRQQTHQEKIKKASTGADGKQRKPADQSVKKVNEERQHKSKS